MDRSQVEHDKGGTQDDKGGHSFASFIPVVKEKKKKIPVRVEIFLLFRMIKEAKEDAKIF